MKKTKIKMNKPVYLDFSILEISKMLMYEFWYEDMIPKYNEKAKLCYILLILKPKNFLKILQMMLKKNLTHQIMNAIPMNAIDHCLM